MTFNEMIAEFKNLITEGLPMEAMNLVSDYMEDYGWGVTEEEELQEVLKDYPVR